MSSNSGNPQPGKVAKLTPFGFIIHPLSPKDAARKYPVVRMLPDSLIESMLRRKKAMVVSHITGVESITGAKTEGWFIGCPLTPGQMTKKLPLEEVYDKILAGVELAQKEGAEIVGLGAFTSVVGDGGITIDKRSPLPITTGNSYTVATAIEGAMLACERLGIEPAEATLAVVGATGSIGKTCAVVMAPHFARTLAIGRDPQKTKAFADSIHGAEASVDVADLKHADVIVTVTSSDAAIIEPKHLKPGSVVCDVARPRDVSVRVSKERPDVLVIEGGVVAVPGDVDFGFNFGFPPKTAYACMSETMLLALENRPEPFTLGKDVSVAQVHEISGLAKKHGFKLAGFRSFEKAVQEEQIERVRLARLR